MSTSGFLVTPTEELLEVARRHPFLAAVRSGKDRWSYVALWARVRQIADKIPDLDGTSDPIGLDMGFEIDFVTTAHAIWLSGRTIVFLSPKWPLEVFWPFLERANVHLILFGSSAPLAVPGVRAVSIFSLVDLPKPPNYVLPPLPEEVVERVRCNCSITPTSNRMGVPKSIVHPMRRGLSVLSEESSAHFKPMDSQWLRGGTTFLGPLFEIRRFIFNRTTLYLDASSVAKQCIALFEELSIHASRTMRVRFTPSVFRIFVEYGRMRTGGSKFPRSFRRVCWIVIDDESLDVCDLESACVLFQNATIICDYACSEVGSTGISQMLIRPDDPIPPIISFGPTHGCTDLVLLDDSLFVIPRSRKGATGIVGSIMSESATHYLGNKEASRHVFRPWDGKDILLYTDDIGCMQADGTDAIFGRNSRNVKINGLFADLDYVEHALVSAFANKFCNATGFKLVKSNTTECIVLFVGTSTSDPISVLKHARDHLRVSYNDDLAFLVGSVRYIPQMPFNALHKIDIIKLQKMADSTETIPFGHFDDALVTTPLSEVDALSKKIAAKIKILSNSPNTIPTTSITMIRLHFWLQSEYEYLEQMAYLFDEDATTHTIALEIVGNEVEVTEQIVIRTTSPASNTNPLTVFEYEDINVCVSEKPPDFTTQIPPTVAPETVVGEEIQHCLIEKEYGHENTCLFNSRQESTVQSYLETATPNVVNSAITYPTLHLTAYAFLFVSWLTPLLHLGSKRPLSESDLLPLRQNDEAIVVERWMEPFWTQLRTWFFDRIRKKPKLFRVLFSAVTKSWLISGVLWFFSICAAVLSPLVLQQIIVAEQAPLPPTGNATAFAKWTAIIKSDTGGFLLIVDNTYALGGILMGLKLIVTFCGRSSDQLVKRMAFDLKTTLIAAIYKKSLRLSAESSQKYGKGHVMNLVNVDCESVTRPWEVVHQVWSIPLQLVTVVVLLSRLVGVSAWASIPVLLFSLFLLIMVVPMLMRRAAPWFMRLGDRRLRTIREILHGIRVVKINGLEKHFLEKTEGIRTEQLHWLRKFNLGVAVFVVIGQITNTLMPLAAFSLFGRGDMGKIPASIVFPAISFFGMLVDPLIALPQLLSAIVLAVTSWGRIYSFLLADEKTSTTNLLPSIVDIGHAITITNGAFSWTALGNDDTSSPAQATDKAEVPSINDKVNENEVSGPVPFLYNVNISIRIGSLTAIVGNVGSGKSSLMSAIIGEMIRVSGEVVSNGSMAYCAQQPWVQTSTIQDNILFGRPLDMDRLQNAIEATCFNSDLVTFPHGMATEMSENGNNLSGGQKARLALSRAVYSDADIYLFDDVLASLDPRISYAVFNNCIKHVLQGKTRVFITHQLQYLNKVDHIIVVSGGTIAEQGSFDDLISRNGELTHLLKNVQAPPEDSDNTKDAKRKSISSPQKATPKQQENTSQVIAEEEQSIGAVDAATWCAYLQATGGTGIILMLLFEVILLQGSVVVLNQWLTWWMDDTWHEKAKVWIGIYDGIGFTSALAIVILNMTILFSSARASRTFHSKVLQGVIYAPMWWLESQPIGRIMNRFSKDIESIDQRLMPQLFQLVAGIGNLISMIIILGYNTPIMLAFVFPMMIVYWFILRFYRKSLRELKRLESTGRGPLQSRINETLDGLPTIMAYGRQTDFENAVYGLIDASNKPTFLKMYAEIWVALRMEIMSSLVVFALAMLAHTKVVGNKTQFALALTSASTLTYLMNLFLRSAANVEAEMNAVERLMSYTTSLPKEDPAYLGSDPAEGTWPSDGEIILRNVDAAYHSRPDKLVLRSINLTFYAGETVFIVGRTGSGKSTLLSLLLRMIESRNGTVEIDGRDIKSLGVSTLRRGMQVIPQDPFIFSGTIRASLDFDAKHEDEALWHALNLVGLKDFVASQESKLDTVVEDNGSNYSVGQRQLLCLAAAMLRNPRILLLDEATASIDTGADVFIQQAMRRSCPHATILSVMHRLSDKILEECDRVLVMEQGVAIEYDSPRQLLAQPNSMFAKLMATARNSH